MTRTCECGQRLPISEGRGRPLAYCSPRCRQRAYRARRAVRPAPAPVLPVEMTSRARWVRWEGRERNGKIAKVPVTVSGRLASVTDPSTWSTYAEACASSVGTGVGFVLDGDGIGCIDLDDAIDEHGALSAEAARIVAEHPQARAGGGVAVEARAAHLGPDAVTAGPAVHLERPEGGGVLEGSVRHRHGAAVGGGGRYAVTTQCDRMTAKSGNTRQR